MINAGTFDLETSSLDPDFGIILCGVVLPASGPPIIVRGDEVAGGDWKTRRSDDRATVRELVRVLKGFDVLAAHNGLWFDVPYLRRKLAIHGMDPLPEFKLVDPFQLARRKLSTGRSRNSLKALSESLTTRAHKTPLSGRVWIRAALDGSKSDMDKIVKHCIADCRVLAEVVDKVKPYCREFNTWGSSR